MSINIVEPLSYSIDDWTKLVQKELDNGNTIISSVALPMGFPIKKGSTLDKPAIATIIKDKG